MLIGNGEHPKIAADADSLAVDGRAAADVAETTYTPQMVQAEVRRSAPSTAHRPAPVKPTPGSNNWRLFAKYELSRLHAPTGSCAGSCSELDG